MSEHNPYQAPKSPVADKPEPGALAERGQRLGAAVIDGVIGLVFAIPIMWGLGIWEYAKEGSIPLSVTIMSIVLGLVMFLAAHGYFLRMNGQTIGKKLIGIRIADLDNRVPEFWRLIALRYLPIMVVSAVPILGNILIIVDVLFIFRSDRRCIHDLIAGTRVVRVK